MQKLAYGILFLVAVIWGSGFIFSQMALDAQISPFIIMAIRFSIATLILGIIFYKKIVGLIKYEIKAGIITGLFLYLAFAFQTIGLKYTTPSSNAFLTAINVIIVPIIFWVVYKKVPRKSLILGSLLAVIGVGLITVQKGFSISMGDTLSLLCSVGFAFHIFCIGHYGKKVEVAKLIVLQMGVAAILSVVSTLIFDNKVIAETTFTMEGIIAVVYLGVMSTCLAFFLQTYAQKYTSAVKTSIILSSEALFATLFSVALGYDILTVRMVVGGLLIFMATIVAEKKSKGE